MLHKDGDSSANGKGVVLRVRLPWMWNYEKQLLCDRHNDRCHLHFILLDFHNNSPTKKVVFLKMKTWYSNRWSDQPRGHISCQKSREAAVTLCFIPQGSWAKETWVRRDRWLQSMWRGVCRKRTSTSSIPS